MYISHNWLKELVDIDDISIEELTKRLGLATAEIEGYEKKGDDMSDVVIAKVVTCEKLENTNHLNLLSVDDGSGDMLQIVTGAPNVYAGMKTALVRVGGKVGGHKISKAKLAGIDSFGMCCSEAELGIGSDDEGIVDFKNLDEPVGTDLKSIFPIDDYIIEFDNKSLTNRPDLWGHLGFAREISAIFNRKIKNIEIVDLSKLVGLKKLNLKVETTGCLRYSALTIDNVTQNRSPYLIKIRLNYCGLRDINLLADLTNYVMLELGQPMHAFDNELVDGIIVRDSFEGEKLLTLENEEHNIKTNSILICDNKNQPVAIAGIKGGLKSGITDETHSFLLESAVFDSMRIRKTSRGIGLITDSSLRYEKSLDPETTPVSIARLVAILKNIDKNIIVTSDLTDVINYKKKSINIELDADFIRKRVGLNIPNGEIVKILTRLGFVVSKLEDNVYSVLVPSFRATKDISIKEDLVEEVARMYGYDNIVPQSISLQLLPKDEKNYHFMEYKTKRLLAEKYGVNEVHTYIWNNEDFNRTIGVDEKSFVSLMDASNSGQAGIRSELIPTLLKVYDENKNNFEQIRICEVGRVVEGLDDKNLAIEKKKLAILVSSETDSDINLYFLLKKMIENINSSHIGAEITYGENSDKSYFHPLMSTKVFANGKEIGEFGVLHPNVALRLSKKTKVACAEMYFNEWFDSEKIQSKFVNVSKYQSVHLDFNFLVPSNIIYSQLKSIISEFRCKMQFDYKLKDIYENKEQLGDNKSMTFGFEIFAYDRTLSSNEIDNFSRRLIDHMKAKNIALR